MPKFWTEIAVSQQALLGAFEQDKIRTVVEVDPFCVQELVDYNFFLEMINTILWDFCGPYFRVGTALDK